MSSDRFPKIDGSYRKTASEAQRIAALRKAIEKEDAELQELIKERDARRELKEKREIREQLKLYNEKMAKREAMSFKSSSRGFGEEIEEDDFADLGDAVRSDAMVVGVGGGRAPFALVFSGRR